MSAPLTQPASHPARLSLPTPPRHRTRETCLPSPLVPAVARVHPSIAGARPSPSLHFVHPAVAQPGPSSVAITSHPPDCPPPWVTPISRATVQSGVLHLRGHSQPRRASDCGTVQCSRLPSPARFQYTALCVPASQASLSLTALFPGDFL